MNPALIVSVVASIALGRESAGPFLALGAIMALFLAIGLVYLLIDQTLGRFIPPLKRAGGAVLLILACYPWLISAGLGVFMLVRATGK